MSICTVQKRMEEIELSLSSFLSSKPLYYAKIDYTRMPRAYNSIKSSLNIPKIIHIMGTNAKGTTGRFLAGALHKNGCNVGHYSSPHILEFNERIWLNGKNVDDSLLDVAHEKLLTLLDKEFLETLSYFEYTTFIAMVVYEKCDYIVLEAGLGGEHDATSVFESVLSIYTPIDMDHEAFLGDSLELVAKTKLRAMGKRVLIAKQTHQEVTAFAIEIAKSYNSEIIFVEDDISPEDSSIIASVSKELQLANYLEENLFTAMNALKLLGIPYDVSSFEKAKLFGRLMRVNENITLDVGHNVLAAKAIKEAYASKKIVLIYNSFEDKDYTQVLSVLKDIILHVEVLHVEDSRIVKQDALERVLETLDIKYRDFNKIESELEYLVFGSFSVAETFLRVLNEQKIYNNDTR